MAIPKTIEQAECEHRRFADREWFIRTNRHRTTWGEEWGWVDLHGSCGPQEASLWCWEGADALKKTAEIVAAHNASLKKPAAQGG